MARDYYEVLGVGRDADARTIKRAFLDKARELHPDVSDDPDAEAKFKEVNEAYSVLSDETKRSNYDRFGSADGPVGGGFDMSDIFGGGLDDIFSSFFGGSGQASARARTRGRDMGIRLSISLAEAAAGCAKTVAYDRMATCEECGGSGVAEGGSVDTCTQCGGSGRVTTYQRTILGAMQTQATCPTCNGQGKSVSNPCPACAGDGRVRVHEKVRVEIPAGVDNGQQLTVGGKGEAGLRGDTPGDLFVQVFVESDARFERDGDDLWCEQEISAFDAMLGCTVEIEGVLDGEMLSVHVPAGTQPGDRIAVPGGGMPRFRATGRGRLIVVVHVHIPESLSDEERAQLAAIAEQHHEGAGFDHAKEQQGRIDDFLADAAAAEPAKSEPDPEPASGRKRPKRPRKRGRK